MTDTDLTGPGASQAGQKPRVVLMGEFSAGKSTLSNILLEGAPLPMRVTATRLPPVHISFGAPSARAEGFDGTFRDISNGDLELVALEDTRAIHLTMRCDLLELCDLVDMPGISDPNMPGDMWDNVIEPRDHVIWCTHATQAWRQSEAAMWEQLAPSSSGANLLLITQIDKLRTPRDRVRVQRRVTREIDGAFSAVYPVSLLMALEAGDDAEAWQESGTAAFTEQLVDLLVNGVAQPKPE
ncbi:MAG: dynamin family protein, partial [Pseudomonadota bacterium]|nr:dynamin family protein [Pseudomonadota bacterium]